MPYGEPLEELLGKLDIPPTSIPDIVSLFESLKPMHIPKLTDKQEYLFAKSMERTAQELDGFAEEDLPVVVRAIRDAPGVLLPHFRFTLAVRAPDLVAKQGIRGIHTYLEKVQPITDRSIFMAAGLTALTQEERDTSPISFDALCYATARAAMYRRNGVVSINVDGEPSINNYDVVVNTSRSILEALATYPEEQREEIAHAVLPFYCDVAPRSTHAIEFLERAGHVYQADPTLLRPFGVTCAQIAERGVGFVRALEVSSRTIDHIAASGTPETIWFWESVAELANPYWSIVTAEYLKQGDEALQAGDTRELRDTFNQIVDLKRASHAYKILDLKAEEELATRT